MPIRAAAADAHTLAQRGLLLACKAHCRCQWAGGASRCCPPRLTAESGCYGLSRRAVPRRSRLASSRLDTATGVWPAAAARGWLCRPSPPSPFLSPPFPVATAAQAPFPARSTGRPPPPTPPGRGVTPHYDGSDSDRQGPGRAGSEAAAGQAIRGDHGFNLLGIHYLRSTAFSSLQGARHRSLAALGAVRPATRSDRRSRRDGLARAERPLGDPNHQAEILANGPPPAMRVTRRRSESPGSDPSHQAAIRFNRPPPATQVT